MYGVGGANRCAKVTIAKDRPIDYKEVCIMSMGGALGRLLTVEQRRALRQACGVHLDGWSTS